MGIFKKGRNWYIDYYVKGQRKRKKIGPSKQLAELALKDVQVKIAKGEYLGIYEEKKVLFGAFAQEYLAFSKINKAPKTADRDATSLKALTQVFTGYLHEISPKAIEAYKAARLEQGLKPSTINKELALLKHMLRMAVEWGYLRENPARGVKALKELPGRLRYLTEEEIPRLLAACGPRLRPVVVCALHTGMRKGEILGLRWSQVNLRDRTITLTKTKNNEVRIIPINDTLFEELRALPRRLGSDYVFWSGRSDRYVNVTKVFHRAVRRAGIEDFRFHDLRHTYASHLVMRGANLRTVQQLLGHKTLQMTMRYSHLSQDHLQQAVKLLDGLQGKEPWRKKGALQEGSGMV